MNKTHHPADNDAPRLEPPAVSDRQSPSEDPVHLPDAQPNETPAEPMIKKFIQYLTDVLTESVNLLGVLLGMFEKLEHVAIRLAGLISLILILWEVCGAHAPHPTRIEAPAASPDSLMLHRVTKPSLTQLD